MVAQRRDCPTRQILVSNILKAKQSYYYLISTGFVHLAVLLAVPGSLEPSHILRSMGIPYTILHGSIRFSLSRYNTDADIDAVLAVLPAIVRRLRELSPFKNDDAAWLKDQEQALAQH